VVTTKFPEIGSNENQNWEPLAAELAPNVIVAVLAIAVDTLPDT
jgi:hypothetical protein